MRLTPDGWGDEALLEAFRRLGGHDSGGRRARLDYVQLPAITIPDFSLMSILNDPSYILDGVDWALGAVQDILGSSFAQDIPLVGDKLGKAANFLQDLRLGFLADLREKLDHPGAAIEFIRDSIWDVFGTGGLNIIRDRDGNGTSEKDDIKIGWYDENGVLVKVWKEGERVPEEDFVYNADWTYAGRCGRMTFRPAAIDSPRTPMPFRWRCPWAAWRSGPGSISRWRSMCRDSD